MYELTGKIQGLALDFTTKKPTLTLQVNEEQTAKNLFDELHEAEKVAIKIGKHREKRSRDANAYFWVLCGKLAAKTRQKKEDIYLELVRDIGDNCEVLPIRNDAVEKFISCWGQDSDGRKKLGWVCDILGDSKIDGYTNVCAYYGSSTYSREQFSVLIDRLVFACEEQGIQTETPDQIAKMKSLWGE